MDSPLGAEDAEDELAALRQRAYGPDADIYRDPEALARLSDLENAARPQPPRSGTRTPEEEPPTAAGRGEREARPTEPSPVQGPSAAAASEAVARVPQRTARAASPAPSPAAATDDAAARTRRPWWRRSAPVWALIATAVVVAAAALTLPRFAPPFADATLPVMSDNPIDFDRSERLMLRRLEIDVESVRQHRGFASIAVWSGTNDHGGRCLLIEMDSNWVNASCASAPLDPIVDLPYFARIPRLADLALPEGSVIRFILRGDVVEVWVAAGTEPA